MFEKILELIKAHKRIIIHRHKNPDGDALGSQIGLYHIIKDSFAHKEVFMVGDMTPRYAFMAERPMDVIEDSAYKGALAIILDTSAKALICDDRYTLAERPDFFFGTYQELCRKRADLHRRVYPCGCGILFPRSAMLWGRVQKHLFPRQPPQGRELQKAPLPS